MNNENERTNKWLNGFYNFVKQDAIDLLPLFEHRIYFFPEGDEENSIKIGFEDLDEIYASKDDINKMRALFQIYAHEHKV